MSTRATMAMFGTRPGGVLLGALLLTVCSASAQSRAGGLPVEPASRSFAATAHTQTPQGKSAVSDPVVIDFDGYQKLLEKHRGKAVLVNFWATWCEPCREEFPMLSEIARQNAGQGLVVLAVSLDEDVDINLVRTFIAGLKPAFPIYRKKPGKDEAFINAVDIKWSGALPATFFYDREGHKANSLVGEHQRPEFDKIIQQLLNTSKPAAAKSAP